MTDVCSGHGGFPSRENDQGSPNVFTDGLPNHRQTDHWVVHSDGDSSHDSELCAGSATVYTNGLQQGVVGSPVCCGSVIATGSGTAFSL